MTNKKLEWKYLSPDLSKLSEIFNQKNKPLSSYSAMSMLQTRLTSSLIQFCSYKSPSNFMLLTAQENEEYFKLISNTLEHISLTQANPLNLQSVTTDINTNKQNVYFKKNKNTIDNKHVLFQEWVEHDQLFGSARFYKNTLNLQPGLIHKANGGILIIGAKTFIIQPILWFRIKQMILQKRFDWLSINEYYKFPIKIPSFPLNLRLIIIGNRDTLSEFNNLEPELVRLALYGEFEEELYIDRIQKISKWCIWVNTISKQNNLPLLHNCAWTVFIKQSIRYSGDQNQLPLCPQWISRRLKESMVYSSQNSITALILSKSDRARIWRESYFKEQMKQNIIEGQILVETVGFVIGQVNALSVLDVQSHPLQFGEPSRISCVVHFGDGEIHDVERKSDLGGNIHTKGMMIMQAFLMSSLKLEQQFPFSASLVFEQSYGEVDGDSASLAELVALISALASKPVDQQIAVTGSVDQFGRVQPIGGVNEKIEGFFYLCQIRKLTHHQGVIIPSANVRHLCLDDNVIKAVHAKEFFIWPVDTIHQALEILTLTPFYHKTCDNLISSIQDRITKINLHGKKNTIWNFRWLNFFK